MASDGMIIFAPHEENSIGLFDPVLRSFTVIDISASITSRKKFVGAAATANGLIVFAPYDADSIGVFDVNTRTFRLVPFQMDSTFELVGDDPRLGVMKYRGAAASVSGLVVFAPYRSAKNVGLFDPVTESFSTVDISHDAQTTDIIISDTMLTMTSELLSAIGFGFLGDFFEMVFNDQRPGRYSGAVALSDGR
eukprot:3916325-Prymnesium_polylepis.1